MTTKKDHAATDVVETGFVRVYRYTYWDEGSQTHKTSERFATLELIRCGLGEPIHADSKKVRPTELIEGGFAE